ncbi:MAG: copper chaperone PCu(A)C [Chloroflexota bacterium]
MKQFSMILLAGIFLLSACNAATGMQVSNAWTRPAAKDGNGAVYFLLQNHSAGADEMTGVSSDIAAAVEIHESKMEGDVMQMQQVMSIPLGGRASVEFAPGGYHVMLIGLKQDVKLGDQIQITLQFVNHEDITISVPVQENGGNSSTESH